MNQRDYSFHDTEDGLLAKQSAIAGDRLVTTHSWELDYRFETHFHPYVDELVQRLIEGSIKGLQDADTAVPELREELFTNTRYKPSSLVLEPYPVKNLALGEGEAYAVYNWELFFHVPLTVAIHLSRAQRFAEAQQWFHYVFDPTDDSDGPTPERFWKFQRFRTTDTRLIEEILLNLGTGADPDLLARTVNSIAAWKDAPFRPHVVARYRPSAFMFKTVMAYLDNLVAWGDALFREDTRETINEATQLYVLAANILGPKPQPVPRGRPVRPKTYADFRERLDAMSNALDEVETSVQYDRLPTDDRPSHDRTTAVRSIGASLYFCVPRNDRLLGYWSTVADRLFKIRNSLNIRGIFRQHALFDPPIDPALLARAAASGLDVGAIVGGLNQPLPLVRFRFLIQKAQELGQEVKSLGGQLLSAIQQEDGETLTLLRAKHERAVLDMAETVRYAQLQEAIKNREGLEQSIANTFERHRYYERLLGRDNGDLELPELDELDRDALDRMKLRSSEPTIDQRDVEITIDRNAEGMTGGRKLSPWESGELMLDDVSQGLRLASSLIDLIGGTLSTIPEMGIKGQIYGIGVDVTIGGREFTNMFSMIGSTLRTGADLSSALATRSAKIGGYARREQDWAFQSNAAAGELTLMFKQLRAAQIREAIAERELENHREQMRHAEEVRAFLEDEKTTGAAFYAWMKREARGLYAQAYELAFDLAKKAERALQHELGDARLSFVAFGHLAGKEGLLAGEKLGIDLRRMELAYHDLNQREYEITTNVSLRQLDALALLRLRATGSCTIVLPEEAFDVDCPGHYFRRIRSIAISIPGVVGPYTGLHARLTLTKSRVRISPSPAGSAGYDWEGPEDARFSDHYGSVQSIITSSGQHDSGLFEPTPGDDRYLPFEGTGAISQWRLDLPHVLRTFDYGTIADVILHVRYTAREGGDSLATAAVGTLKARIKGAEAAGQTTLLSLRHDFPDQWARFKQAVVAANAAATVELELTEAHYPFWTRGRVVSVSSVQLFADTDTAAVEVTAQADRTGPKDALVADASLDGLLAGRLTNVTLPAALGTFAMHLDDNSQRDLWVALTWGVELS